MANARGFFGKLLTMGDFVSRGWSSSTREGLDRLLQEAISAFLASSTSGKDSLLQAPYVMLTIRPGVVGEQGLEIVILPSQDRVGRIFPLCAGLQRAGEGQSEMNWPSLDYGRALIESVQRRMEVGADPELLLSDIESVGEPHLFRATFAGRCDDETLPRLPTGTKNIRIQGPSAVWAPSTGALCALLRASSDLLGVCFDDRGEAVDYFACLRFESGEPLAAIFDAKWGEREWYSVTLPGLAADSQVAEVQMLDEDATRPRQRVIDIGKSEVDSSTDS